MSPSQYRICRLCSSYMGSHPTLHGWLKCPACGFSKIDNPVISLEDYLMGRDKLYPTDYTHDIFTNACIILEKVNAMLYDLGIKKAAVSSGWRPLAVNKNVTNAAINSPHIKAMAVDILDDKNQSLCKLILTKPDLLTKYGLWMEDPISTVGKYTNWTHLDFKTRSDRPLRVFKIT